TVGPCADDSSLFPTVTRPHDSVGVVASRSWARPVRGGGDPGPPGRAHAASRYGEDPMTSTAIFVGIDIAKADFVVACCPEGRGWTATNDREGIAATVDRVRALAPTLIVVAATGG